MSSPLSLEKVNEFIFVEDIKYKRDGEDCRACELEKMKSSSPKMKCELLISHYKDVISKHELEIVEVIARHEAKTRDVATQLEEKVK